MNKLLKSATVIALISFSMGACKKDEPSSQSLINMTNGGLLIANEGEYNQGNSGVSYLSTTGDMYPDYYHTRNQTALGDVCQSLTEFKDKIYIVVNNSGKIEVCDKSTLSKTQTISGFASPRYVLIVDSSKAYVSDLYADHISILNLASNTISGTIQLQSGTEEMLLLNNKVYITCLNSPELYVADPTTNTIVDSIAIIKGGNYVTSDNNGKLWLLSIGDYFTSQPGGLFRINPANDSIEFSYTFPSTSYPSKLRRNAAGNELFFIDTDIRKISSTATVYPSTSLISGLGKFFYGLEISTDGSIYATDAVDFQSSGRLYHYSSTGTQLNAYTTGINPSYMLIIK